MKSTLKLEELAMLILGIYLFSLLDFQWWWFLVYFLAPDIGMFGYLFNAKIGAITYNICHHKGIAIILYLAGIYFENSGMQFAGIILFAHASFDRILGYGLKYFDAFKHTHLGKIGK